MYHFSLPVNDCQNIELQQSGLLFKKLYKPGLVFLCSRKTAHYKIRRHGQILRFMMHGISNLTRHMGGHILQIFLGAAGQHFLKPNSIPCSNDQCYQDNCRNNPHLHPAY